MTTSTDADGPRATDLAAVMALSGAGLRVAVAREVMGIEPFQVFGVHYEKDEKTSWGYDAEIAVDKVRNYMRQGLICRVVIREDTWEQYDNDHNAAAEVLAEVEKRGLQREFGTAIVRVLPCGFWDGGTDILVDNDEIFRVATASPTDKCRAALLAVRQVEAKERTGEG